MKNFMKYIFCFLYVFVLPVYAAFTPEIRKMNPPKLQNAHLGKQIICYRPKRLEGPRWQIELIENKIIVHNYGHGGAGWSLAPGSANYVVKLLQKERPADFSKETAITVVGAGVVGLFTAYTLHQQGYQHITIVADRFDNMTSHQAGGTFSPEIKIQDKETNSLKYQIALDSLHFYQSIAKKQHRDFKSGVTVMPAYFKSVEEASLEPFVGQGILPAKPVILDFGNGTKQEMIVYDDGIFIDVEKMMQLLTRYLEKQGVIFNQHKINDFTEIKDNILFNCTGLGAKALTGDELIPAQGHLIMLKDQNPADLQQMLLVIFDKSVTQHGQEVWRLFYLFPKQTLNADANAIGVLGGTYVMGADDQTPNEQEFDILLHNAKAFYGIKE